MHWLLYLLAVPFLAGFCSSPPDKATPPAHTASITRIEMSLSAFGVESDDFPSIDATIDFVQKSSKCTKTYYNPAYKPATYTLSTSEIEKVWRLLQAKGLEKLKPEYTVLKTDQPTSTLTIYAGQRRYTIKDYGLVGEYLLRELYTIVYKL